MPNMFCIKDVSFLNEDWVPFSIKGFNRTKISNKTLKQLKRQDILAISFLFQAYKKGLLGVILNEDTDMNTKLQVAVFLQSLVSSKDDTSWVLIVSPEKSIAYWHYHLTVQGNFKVQMVTSETCIQDLHEESNVAILLSFRNLKLLEILKEYCFFVVIVDDIDAIATKLPLKKLQGNFNIGLTERNFYVNPNQKLHWNLLNWSNPGCVGKLCDFYEKDNVNFANFSNSYKHWWYRLTWNFCDSLVPSTQDELQVYRKIVQNWAESNEILDNVEQKKLKRQVRNCGENQNSNETLGEKGPTLFEQSRNSDKRKKIVFKSRKKKVPANIKYKFHRSGEDSNDSSDTLIYEPNEHGTSYIKISENILEPASHDENNLSSVVLESTKRRRVEVNVEKEEDSDDILKTFTDSWSNSGEAVAVVPSISQPVQWASDKMVTESDDFIKSLVCYKPGNSARFDYGTAERILMEADKLLES